MGPVATGYYIKVHITAVSTL